MSYRKCSIPYKKCSIPYKKCSMSNWKRSISNWKCFISKRKCPVPSKENHRTGKKDDGFMSKCVKFTHLYQIVGADVRRLISNAEFGMWIVEYK